jgi:hypothetical protein
MPERLTHSRVDTLSLSTAVYTSLEARLVPRLCGGEDRYSKSWSQSCVQGICYVIPFRMIQSGQVHRPQVSPSHHLHGNDSTREEQVRAQQHPPPTPLFQQQIRISSSQATPRSQIEAMPPMLLQQPPFVAYPAFDPAKCHPVFFTPALRKPPFPLFGPGHSMVNPVAFGYVAENGARKEGAAKL